MILIPPPQHARKAREKMYKSSSQQQTQTVTMPFSNININMQQSTQNNSIQQVDSRLENRIDVTNMTLIPPPKTAAISNSVANKHQQFNGTTSSQNRTSQQTALQSTPSNIMQVNSRLKNRIDLTNMIPPSRLIPATTNRTINNNTQTAVRFDRIDQQWDYANPCNICGKVYLKSVSKETAHDVLH